MVVSGRLGRFEVRKNIEQLQLELDHAKMDAEQMRGLAGERMACIRSLEKERDDLKKENKVLYRLLELLELLNEVNKR